MLSAHLNAFERALLAMGKVPGNAGHSVHIGTPREWLLRSFLGQHLPTTVELGSGEVVCATSTRGDKRNQFDLIVHRREHPRIDYGGGINAFFVEAVEATIEVKSTLTYKGFLEASLAARKIKQMSKSIATGAAFGPVLPTPFSFLVAYRGPRQMETIYSWVARLRADEAFAIPGLPRDRSDRMKIKFLGINAIFILGRGFFYFDTMPFGMLPQVALSENPVPKWVFANQKEGNLMIFFLMLTSILTRFKTEQLDPVAYLQGTPAPVIQCLP